MIALISEDGRDPLNEVKLDHDGLRFTTQRELLKCTQSILSEMCITLFVFKDGYQCFDKIALLEEVTSSQAFIAERINKRHGVLEDTSITLQKQLIDDLVLARFVNAVEQIVVHIRIDHLLKSLLSSGFCEPPSEGLESRTDLDGFVRFKKKVLDKREVERCKRLLGLLQLPLLP